MRIVHVTDSYLPTLGGIETHVSGLLLHQRAAGHDVHVVTGTGGLVDDGGQADGLPTVHRLGTGWRTAARGLALGSVGAQRLLGELAPDVVHCHASIVSPLAAGCAAAASDSGIPTAVTVHSLWPDNGLLLRAVAAALALHSRRIAWSAVSDAAADPLRRVLADTAAVSVLPNAVDVQWWRGAAPVRTSTAVRVISVMRLSGRKRPLPLVRMMAQVRAQLSSSTDLTFVLVGDGPQAARVARCVRRLGIAGWVELPGRLSREAIRAELAASDVYVAPADLESFGIAALEARCVGLPVVAKAGGGVSEFVTPGVEGVLARSDSDMVSAITGLVGSPGLRSAIRRHNREVVPDLGWPPALARTAALYDRALSLSGRPLTSAPLTSVPLTAVPLTAVPLAAARGAPALEAEAAP